MEDKNHDYGEAWREMRVSSQQIQFYKNCFVSNKSENNKGKNHRFRGIDTNYQDMINYAISH
jgi:hypothetical protein